VNELQTSRLALVPITFEMADATLRDKSELESLLGLKVSEEWPNPDFRDALEFVRSDVRRDPGYSEWTRLIVHSFDRLVIGDAGFKSKPDSTGAVEIGYGVVRDYRNRGVAFEASAALIEWAFRQQGVKRVVAECYETNEPSIRVLRKLGMEITHSEEATGGRMLKWAIDAPEE
jgi:[ribosomal protein S5]-alanine N-acetyltransferase